MRSILAVHSDTHGGSKFALMNPATELFDEDEEGNLIPYTPEPTEAQNYLWGRYTSDIESLRKLAGDDEIAVIHNGDMSQGKKYPRALVSTRDADQAIIAEDNLRPYYDMPNMKHMRIAAGTGAHNFEENSLEITVQRFLRAQYRDHDTQIVRHGLLDYNGVLVNYAHHGPHPGSRDWLRGNVALYYLRDFCYKEDRAGRPVPDLVFRSHYHTRVKVMLDWHGKTVTLMITPSYSLLDDHAQQATRSEYRITVGQYAVEIIDGKIKEIHEFTETVDMRTAEVIK